METKKQSEGTKPIDNFGTAPVANLALKQTNYAGTLLKDRYLIEGELGRGGIGVVYLARDTQLMQRRVVIKVLLESSENSLHTPWFRKKFDQEIEALIRIDHPGVVGVLDVGAMPDGKPFFVMQFVEGATLRNLMQKEAQPGKLELARVAHIVRQVGVALTAAHDKGIIHRDLKPENVMAQMPKDGEEVIKLIDFGIATVKDSQNTSTDTGKTKVAGALPYMAPEQLRGEPQAASDTWSLGVMAYELLTGQLPFNADTLIQLHEQQKQSLFARPGQLRLDLPAAAEQVILKAMAYAPEARHARARDFGDALSEALLNVVPRATQTNAPLSWQTSPSAPTMAASEAEAKAITDAMTGTMRLPAKGRSPLPYFALAFFLLAAGVGIVGYLKMRAEGSKPNTPLIVPAIRLNYSITATLVADKNKPGSKPTEFAGEAVFTPGDRLRINFTSPQDSYLYIINEGPEPDPKTGLPRYNVLFPDPKQVGVGVPSLKANQPLYIPPLEQPGNEVDKESGTETLWLIWSERSLNEFEAFRKWLDLDKQVEITDAGEIKSVQEFLQRNRTAAKPVVEKDERQTHLKGGPDGLLVYPLRVEHR